ncbi:hypothetical protein GRI89_16995 [Altererythrobacter salegens]|uniref:MipA/OmpV family protein n=1 Tax=Croceibacterium salegens TaxID=1737568 RepID=A0A6I4SYU4_9SPHN|nr:MipA/OmpV family protein [Croceibacterium salegens]MXO61244.1 hypothetical protein [Croceibacterium salegens]
MRRDPHLRTARFSYCAADECHGFRATSRREVTQCGGTQGLPACYLEHTTLPRGLRTKAREARTLIVSKFYQLPVAAAIAALFAAPASAEDKEPWRYRVGAGAQVKPQYPGADDVSVLPMFDIDRTRGDEPFEFEAADDSFGFNLVNSGGFEFGPAVSLVGKRKSKEVGTATPNVDRIIEVGAFANYWLGENFRLHSEVRRGVTGHEGWEVDGGADVVWRDGDKWLVSLGPRVTWADHKFHDAYFSVTPATSLATGLPVYEANGGLESYGATASGELALTQRWGLSLYAKYERLTGDAADSPIVRQYGSRDQFSGGLALSYTFGR